MSRVRLLVETRKVALILTSEGKLKDWISQRIGNRLDFCDCLRPALVYNGLPRNKYTSSITKIMTTVSSRKNARLWLN
jgi:hypothetical protein